MTAKIAGAAQRRTRRGLLQQGSVQGIDLESDSRANDLHESCPQIVASGKVDEKKILNRARGTR